MTTLQERIETSTSQLETDSDLLHDVVHGDSSTTVTTEGGPVKSLAKSIADMETEYAANAVIAEVQANNTDSYNWANRAEDNQYTDGDARTGYSAFHWAQKAQGFKDQAEAAASIIPNNKFDATSDPTVNDDSSSGYSAGSNWLNITSQEAFKCIDASIGAAVWVTTTLTIDELGTAAAQDVGVGSGNLISANQSISTIASASTVNLSAVSSLEVSITGVTTVDEFVGVAGVCYKCKSVASFSLVNGASLLLPTSSDIETEPGDTFEVYMIDSNTAELRNYQRKSGEALSTPSSSGLTLGAAQSTASGTQWDFAVPSGVKQITVSFVGVSFAINGTPIVEIGDAGGVETFGYVGTVQTAGTTNAALSSGFSLIVSGFSTDIYEGSMTLTLVDPSTNTWACSGSIGRSDANQLSVVGGSKSLSDELTTVRFTSTSGANGNAGTVNVAYQ